MHPVQVWSSATCEGGPRFALLGHFIGFSKGMFCSFRVRYGFPLIAMRTVGLDLTHPKGDVSGA